MVAVILANDAVAVPLWYDVKQISPIMITLPKDWTRTEAALCAVLGGLGVTIPAGLHTYFRRQVRRRLCQPSMCIRIRVDSQVIEISVAKNTTTKLDRVKIKLMKFPFGHREVVLDLDNFSALDADFKYVRNINAPTFATNYSKMKLIESHC